MRLMPAGTVCLFKGGDCNLLIGIVNYTSGLSPNRGSFVQLLNIGQQGLHALLLCYTLCGVVYKSIGTLKLDFLELALKRS